MGRAVRGLALYERPRAARLAFLLWLVMTGEAARDWVDVHYEVFGGSQTRTEQAGGLDRVPRPPTLPLQPAAPTHAPARPAALPPPPCRAPQAAPRRLPPSPRRS
jgi:hypothetical protein